MKYNTQNSKIASITEKTLIVGIDAVTLSFTTHVVNYKGSIIVIKNVPCKEYDAGDCCFRLFKSSLKMKISTLLSLGDLQEWQ